MKVVILAGGYGTRISEESVTIPKPLVEIGNMPILWHIMKIYSAHGLNDFVICCGYKGHLIKSYFLDFFHRNADFTLDLRNNDLTVHRSGAENWKVTLIDTGLETMTGGRIRRVREHIDGPFCLTYGDGVGDVDITELLAFHRAQGTLATVTAVQQPGRFGALDLSNDRTRVNGFREKSFSDGHLINGGFFVCEPAVLDFIENDKTVFEQAPLHELTARGQLAVYHHKGYWQNMDTLRDKHVLQDQWDSGKAPWKVWDRPAPAKAQEVLWVGNGHAALDEAEIPEAERLPPPVMAAANLRKA